MIPLNLRSKEWVFAITQSISELSIMPALGMVILLLGISLVREKQNDKVLNITEKTTGILSLLFAVGFAGSALLYSISVGGVENNIVDNLKTQAEAAKKQVSTKKEQLDSLYEKYKEKVNQEKYDTAVKTLDNVVENVDTQMMVKINQANSSIIKATFKTMLTLLFFAVLHVFIFLKVFELIDFIKYRVFKLKRKAVNS